MADDGVLFTILAKHTEHVRDETVGAQFACGNGGKGANPERGVLQQRCQGKFVAGEGGLAQNAEGLSAHFRIGVSQEGEQTAGCSQAVRQRSHRLGFAIPSGPGANGWPASGENAEAPNAVYSFERIGGLESGLEAFRGVGAACELQLRAKANPLVGMREQSCQLSGIALGEPLAHALCGLLSGLFAESFFRRQRQDAPLVVRLPAGDKIRDHEASLPIVLHVGGGDPPQEFVGLLEAQSGAVRFQLEGPNPGGSCGAPVVADVEMACLALQKAGARVVGETGGAGADVAGRWNQKCRLHRILHLPRALGHPARRGALFYPDLPVKCVHRLVLHFPPGIRSLDHVHDPGSVSLVGVVVDGNPVAPLVKCQLLGVAQPGVNDFEVRAIRLEAEYGALVVEIKAAAFLGGQVEPAVPDCSPQASIVADGEPVHVMAGQ